MIDSDADGLADTWETRGIDFDDDGTDDPAAAVYGQNYSRLRDLKAKYDPENFFHTNVNIRPR